MFDNLTKEIIFYSLIPVVILALIGLVLVVVKKKDEKKYKYDYLIKIILLLINGLVLPLLIGYSVWATKRFITNNTLGLNIGYVIIFTILIIALAVLLTLTTYKLYRSFSYHRKEEKKSS